MSAVPAASYLIEFDPDGVFGKDRWSGAPGDLKIEDPAARAVEARARGFEEGLAAGRAEGSTELERWREESAQRLASERQAWVAEEGEKLSKQIAAGLGSIEEKIAEAAAHILKPFLIEELRRQANDELLEIVQGLLSKDGGTCLEISGPQDLIEVLRARLSMQSASVRFSKVDGCDVRIVVDQTILETRLGAWVAKIEEALR